MRVRQRWCWRTPGGAVTPKRCTGDESRETSVPSVFFMFGCSVESSLLDGKGIRNPKCGSYYTCAITVAMTGSQSVVNTSAIPPIGYLTEEVIREKLLGGVKLFLQCSWW